MNEQTPPETPEEKSLVGLLINILTLGIPFLLKKLFKIGG